MCILWTAFTDSKHNHCHVKEAPVETSKRPNRRKVHTGEKIGLICRSQPLWCFTLLSTIFQKYRLSWIRTRLDSYNQPIIRSRSGRSSLFILSDKFSSLLKELRKLHMVCSITSHSININIGR